MTTPADVTALKGAAMRPDLAKLIEESRNRGPMTPAEIQEQRISFAFGMLPEGSTVTREQVAERDYARHGNLSALAAALASLTVENERLGELFDDLCYFPTPEGKASHLAKMVAQSQDRVAELTAKLEAPVQVGAAHIRAEALRAAGQVLTDEIEIARIAMPQVVPILAAVRRAILAMIPTPSPSPDVGALVWQDIATAPKDGTWFWGSVDHDAIAMTWHPEFDAFVSSWREMSFAPSYGGGVKPHSPVSHDPREWMPMPARALAAQEGGDDPHS